MSDKKEYTVREAGKLGGNKTAERHGHEFFEEIGRKGGKRLRELIEKGKEQEKNDGPSG
jgi:hypothetical protein